MTAEPIRIPCEGSGQSAHMRSMGVGWCRMCGLPMICDDEKAPAHKRYDILAMLDRGDFG